MANYPKKMMDPTEAALSAIQEALNIRDEDEAVEPEAEGEPDARSDNRSDNRPDTMADLFAGEARTRGQAAVSAAVQPDYEEPDYEQGAYEQPAYKEPADTGAIGTRDLGTRDLGTHDLSALSGRVANDDQQSIGQILQTLQRRPARSSYFVATAFSAAWLVGCAFLAWAFLPDLTAALGPGRSPAALMIGLFAAALLPVIFFFAVAHMAWRAQELRLIAQSMARVAMRLAEPENVASDSIVTVGQAIRREVAAMGDGVERALARASELESLVQSEVAALERTYSDNEVRIRGLLQELSSQRDNLVGQAEQVRSAINNVQIDLTQDLSTISDLVGQQVNEAAMQITQSLADRGENITVQLSQIGDNMIAQLSERGGELLDRLEAASDETSQAISAASERLTANLNFKTNHIGEEFAEIATGIEDMMVERLDRVTEGFSEKSLAVVDLMIGRSQELTDAIIETSSQLAETIATRADEVNSTLKSSGDSLLLDLDLRGGEVAAKMKDVAESIAEALAERSDNIAESLATRSDSIAESLVARSDSMTAQMRDTAEHVAGVLSTRSDAVKEMLTTRLAAFEDMFSHTGAELGERISRDSTTLGNLITRHLAEFDRTVKTYGSELVERLGARTQDVSESMRSYVDTFDNRVTAKADEVTNNLDQRLTRFQDALDNRSQGLTDALSIRLVEITRALNEGGQEITKALNEGGKEAVASLDKRISDVTTTIDARTVKLADTIGDRIANIDSALGKGALEVAHTLDTRVAHLEQLLGGRAEAIVSQMEARSRNVAEQLGARFEQIAETIKTNSAGAERSLVELAANTTDALGKSAAASTAAAEVLNRSAAEATVSLNRSAGTLSNVIAKSAAAANEAIGKSTAGAADLIGRSTAAANEAINKSSVGAADLIAKSTQSVTDLIAKSSQNANDSITRSAADAERKLVGMSSDVARNLVGKANEINTTLGDRVDEMTRVLDEKSNTLISALDTKSQGFAGEVGRITEQTVKAIEAKGFVFTQTMMDKSEEIARLINDASLNATAAVTRTLGQMQEGTHGVTEGAKLTLTRTLEDLHQATKTAIEQSKQTAAATISEMMETHTMLRSDSTALFERLREANILLQEVLSGAQENMSSIEHTMAARISEFVAAMNDLTAKSGVTTGRIEQHLGTFNNVTARVLTDLGDLADQFSSHGRTLTDAVELLDASNQRTAESVTTRQTTIDTLVAALDTRTEDFGQRLERFTSLLDESLDAATTRAREIAGLIAQGSNESLQTLEQQYEMVRKSSEEERKRTSETLNTIYDETLSEVQNMFTQSTERFAEVMQGMKQMAGEMQRELESTRTEMRRGILELPQETAESAAQMRRVIVDQIEALAELNRIVARHGRSLDAVEPARREAEPLYATGGGRGAQARPIRPDVRPDVRPEVRPDLAPQMGPQMGPPIAPQMAPHQQPAPPRDITGVPRRSGPPNLSPVPGGKDDSNGRSNGGGWLSDLLTRASREEGAQGGVSREAPPRDERPPQRDAVDSIDSLSVDIARMIDHDAAAELWERYKRGERGAFSRRLYTPQGAKAFDEIRSKYRTDPEFRQTVEHYIHEFERLLDDVSRGDRGPAVARNYLTSDTGKVYTMLAHAAGRFD